ncbi:MAG TPA: glycosyltransferase [bacterium]|nr:glycosyltransferase [bacterium]HPS29006.1 glycosyltransferase [bacterium]
MESENQLSILFVLETAPENSNSLSFINSYIDSLAEILSTDISLSLFYPEYSETEEYYSLNILPGAKYTKLVTYIPSKHPSFKDTFANEKMENIFRYILKDESFDCIHIWSLKNHSFNYPFIAKDKNIPVVFSICDGFLLSNNIFHKGVSEDSKIKISNFVSTPVNIFLKKAANLFSQGKKKSYWFENIGRYSSYYNKVRTSLVDQSTLDERALLADEVIKFTDRFVFISELEYNLFYRTMIPESKAIFIEQGIFCDGTFENRPFEIEGAVKFGFLGEILPEEGILELIEAFNSLYDNGFHNEIHIYGEMFDNNQYFSRLKKRVHNPNIFFHGPIQPGRINSVLNTFDALIIPSKWHRSDTLLVNTALSSRKAVVVSGRNNISEKVRKASRGIILNEITASSIYEAVSELERNRKRLYYFMRVTDDLQFSDIEENLQNFLNIYSAVSKKSKEFEKVLLKIKLHKKKIDRIRG